MRFALRRWPYALAVVLALLAASLVPEIFRTEAPTPEDPPDVPRHTGRVVLESGDVALPGATVRATGGEEAETVVAGAGGRFLFDPVPAGVREVVVRYGPLSGRAPWRGSDLEVRLSGEYSISGRVADDATGDAVEGALIAVSSLSATSGDRGKFRIDGLRLEGHGLPVIRVTAAGYRDVELRPGPDEAWGDLFVRLVRK